MVIVAQRISLCGESNSDSGENNAQQSTKKQKTLCPVQSIADTRGTLFDAKHSRFHTQSWFSPGLENIQRSDFASKQITISQPAARLDNLCQWHIRQIHEHPRTYTIKSTAAVRLFYQHITNGKTGNTYIENIALDDAKGRQQPALQPNFTRKRPRFNGCAAHKWRIRNYQLPTQRIVIVYCFNRRKLRAIVREHHGQKT